MTLLNSLNVFSNSHRKADQSPSAAFDPSTTGDPVRSTGWTPAVGHGDTQVAKGGLEGPPRRPIGFAPPEDEEVAVRRYRTEISFKRHDGLPRASATPDTPDEPPLGAWSRPETAAADAGAAVGLDANDANDAKDANTVDASVTEEHVPFYKREISFRRKRSTVDEQPEGVVGVDDESDLSAPSDAIEESQTDQASADSPATSNGPADDEATTSGEPVAEEAVVFTESQVAVPAPTLQAPLHVHSESDLAVASEELPQSPQDESIVGASVETVALGLSSEDDLRSVIPPETGPALDVPADGTVPDPLPAVSNDEDLPAAAIVAAVAADPTSSKGRFSRKGGSSRPATEKKRKPVRSDKTRIVGLKIGASQLAAAVVAETESGHELVSLVRRPLALGIVVDGEVRDRDALTHALKSFFDEEKLPKRDIRIGVASNRIALRVFDIAGIEDATQFDNAVRFKAHEVLPVAVNESVLDYRVLDDRPNEAGEPSRRVLLVVAPRDQVEPFVEVTSRAGLGLAGIDLEALGLLRAFVEPTSFAQRTADDTATVVVAIGHESSTLLVSGGGVCEFTRVFDWGGGALEEAISTELDVPRVEAATILRHLSLSGSGRRLETLDDAARARAVEAVRTRLTPFARELVNSLQFYQTQPDSLGIGGILITGGTSHLEGLAPALNQMIGVSVTVGNPLGRIVSHAPFDASIEAAMHSMAVPIGLAISDLAMRSVDLFPRGAAKKRSSRTSLIAVGAPIAAVVPLVALGALYFGAHGTATSRQTALDSVQAQIAALPKPVGPTIDPALAGIDAQRAVGVANVLGGRIAWEQMFRDVSRVLPDNVWLDAMTATAPAEVAPAEAAAAVSAAASAAIPAATPTDVTITGATYTQTDVARLLARLATLPSLSNVTLVSSSTQKALGKKETVQFDIVASLSTTGGAS